MFLLFVFPPKNEIVTVDNEINMKFVMKDRNDTKQLNKQNGHVIFLH